MSPATTRRAADIAAAVADRLSGRPLVIMLDVDGTLAPIAPRPDEARVPERTTRAIAALAATPGIHVALVSGRSATDAARMVQMSPAHARLWVLGNHGLERLAPDGTLVPEPRAAEHEQDVASAAEALEPVVREIPGALLENKRWTLSLHYRLVDHRAVPALVEAARRVAADLGLRTMDGKKIVEIRPPVAIDKGTATVMLAAELGAFDENGTVMFAGDDRTDEDAFRALRARSPRAITVRVGVEPGETSAEFHVGDPEDVCELLESIARLAIAV